MMDSRGNNPLRECSKCSKAAAPEGGIKVSENRWYCAACWIKHLNRK